MSVSTVNCNYIMKSILIALTPRHVAGVKVILPFKFEHSLLKISFETGQNPPWGFHRKKEPYKLFGGR